MTSNGYGHTPAQTLLWAGPFSMIYENGLLRYLRYGGTEIVRMIYLTLRIENWETCQPHLENEIIHTGEKNFAISYTCHYKEDNQILFSWEVHISGNEEGRISFSVFGKAVKDFLKNRAGFCILHPIENTAGNKISITHGDGRITNGYFPVNISPFCPFTDISKMQWENSGSQYIIEMKGDLFEMEDHRNWTDNSFKTYCTLQDLPYPVRLTAGTEINQKIIFYPAEKDIPALQHVKAHPVQISVKKGPALRFPEMGIGSSTETFFLLPKTAGKILDAGFDYYTVLIKPANSEWKENFQRESEIASQLSLDLFVMLELSEKFQQELKNCAGLLRMCNRHLRYILLLNENKPVTSAGLAAFGTNFICGLFPKTQVGVGTGTNFAELNRNLIRDAKFDFVSYSIHPQEHAFDNLTLIENLEAQATTVRSAKLLYPDTKIVVSAVTLRKRLNPYAKLPEDIIQSDEKKADPRQTGLWAAGWTLGSIKYLSEAGVHAVGYFQTIGKQGISDAAGNFYPLGILLKKILTLRKGKILPTHISDPLSCSSLLILLENINYLFLVNHTGKPIFVKTPFSFSNIEILETSPPAFRKSRVVPQEQFLIGPYGVYMLS